MIFGLNAHLLTNYSTLILTTKIKIYIEKQKLKRDMSHGEQGAKNTGLK